MQAFPEKHWDVTNIQEFLGGGLLCLWPKKELTLEREEAVLRVTTTCSSSTQRRPYAQLTMVEQRSACFGVCAGINSDLAPMDEEGHGGIVPGLACDSALVEEIIRELNLRKDGRGKIAQMRQQTFMLDTMSKIGVQVPMLLKHFAVQYPPEASTIQQIFGSAAPLFRPWKNAVAEREPEEFNPIAYDTTCCCDRLACLSKTLQLDPDEAILTQKQWISDTVVTTKVPYANIESVEAEQSCGCSSLTAGELTEHHAIQPGTGCSMDIVEAIRTELQRRVDARGNRRQINQLEEMMQRFDDLAAQLPLLMQKLKADVSYPPSQETMMSVYGPDGPEYLPRQSDQHQEASRQFETKTYDVLNQVQNVCNFICTCGPTKHTVTLTQEEVVTERSNNCCSSTERKPYAQIQEVDAGVCCFCCHGVNGMSPGWCGDEALVNELAQELQDRKVGRGNIAQLRNQENTMVKAVESDIRCDILLHQQQIEYPPSQATMSGIYGAQAPTLPPASGPRGQELHLSASEKMENKMFHIATWCDAYCCCAEHTLELNDEEAVFHLKNCCMDSWSREPYAQLGSVEPAEACNHTCVGVSTDKQHISPGFGCSHALVSEIARELQYRKVKRGNIAQIRQQENLMIEIIKLGVKLDLLLHKCGLSFPPSQAFMDETFGAGSHLPAAQPPPPERRSSKTLVTVKVPMGLRPGDSFPVTTPQGQVQAVVPHGAVEGQEIQVEIPRQPIVSTEMAPLSDNIS